MPKYDVVFIVSELVSGENIVHGGVYILGFLYFGCQGGEFVIWKRRFRDVVRRVWLSFRLFNGA